MAPFTLSITLYIIVWSSREIPSRSDISKAFTSGLTLKPTMIAFEALARITSVSFIPPTPV